MPTGLIVAGGRSTRFGETDKAVAELAGRPLVAHVARGLESSVDRLLVSCRDEQRDAIAAALSEVGVPVSFVVDDREVGPLGGICDGLAASDAEWTLVVGCDFPFVDDSVFRLLAPSTSHDAVVFRYPDGGVQPLCGRYRTEPARQESQQLLTAGDRRARRLVEQLSTRYVDVAAHSDLEGRLENINTPAALADAERRLSASKRGQHNDFRATVGNTSMTDSVDDTDELPSTAGELAEQYPDVWEQYSGLGKACSEAGPVDDETKRLVKLALAAGSESEGAVHSHVRRALDEGVDPEALRHVAILSIPTLGFPKAMATLTWIDDIVDENA